MRESFTGRPQLRLILGAIFGVAAGSVVINYTGQFLALHFLQNIAGIEDTSARLVIAAGAVGSLFWFVLAGWLSDRFGRKRVIVLGYALTLVSIVPLFHWLLEAANPALSGSGRSLGVADFFRVLPPIVAIGFLSGICYGPVAALLVELFPARIRYTSLSVSYHLGTGYFGGLLPFVSQYAVAQTGDPFASLWYTLAVVTLALVVMILWVPETKGWDLG